MNPLTSLYRDHHRILLLVDALEVFIDRLEVGAAVGSNDLARFVDAFVQWVDLVHHEKEEHVLLPFAVRHGFHWDDGCAATIRREHRQERYLIDVLEQASQQEAPWSTESRRHIVATGRACIAFQRRHILHENRVFFSELLDKLSPEALEALRTQLEAFDAVRNQNGALAQLLGRVDRLIENYGSRTSPRFGRIASGEILVRHSILPKQASPSQDSSAPAPNVEARLG